MFKKFLVLAMTMFCSVLWAEEIDIASFEKEAKANANRALELSMYYQGWEASECFYAFDEDESASPIALTYVRDSELSRKIKMRDFNKALHFAEISFEKETATVTKKSQRSDCIVLNLIKLYMLRGENFAKETYDFFIENIGGYDFEEKGKIYGKELGRKIGDMWFPYGTLYSYFYSKGFGVEQNIDFAKDILKYSREIYSWRDFYLQKYHIKDFEFAKFLMEERGGDISNKHFLYLIYSGKFNSEEKDETLANQYFDLYEESINNKIKWHLELREEWRKKYNTKNKIDFLLGIYTTKYFIRMPLYDNYLIVLNPYYNIDIARKHLEGLIPYKKHFILLMKLFYNDSISDSKKWLNVALNSNELNDEEKKLLKDKFEKAYKQGKENFLFYQSYIGDMADYPDFDSL